MIFYNESKLLSLFGIATQAIDYKMKQNKKGKIIEIDFSEVLVVGKGSRSSQSQNIWRVLNIYDYQVSIYIVLH